MKHLVFFLVLISSSNFAQQAQLSVFLPLDSPLKTVMPQMRTNVGLGVSVAYRPVFGFPLFGEFKASFGSYASKSYSSMVSLYEGYDPFKVNASFSSALNKYLLGSKFVLGHDFRALRGFATPQIGLASFRTTNSYNFTDYDNSPKQNSYTAQRNVNTVYGLEVGTEIILNAVFKKMKGTFKHRIAISASFVQGFNAFKYTNVKHVFDTNVTPMEDQLTYVSLPNNYVYENNVTELYKTKLSMWGINVAYVLHIPYGEDGPDNR
jgi:hypothetical protein